MIAIPLSYRSVAEGGSRVVAEHPLGSPESRPIHTAELAVFSLTCDSIEPGRLAQIALDW